MPAEAGAEAGGSLLIQGQLGVHRELQDRIAETQAQNQRKKKARNPTIKRNES